METVPSPVTYPALSTDEAACRAPGSTIPATPPTSAPPDPPRNVRRDGASCPSDWSGLEEAPCTLTASKGTKPCVEARAKSRSDSRPDGVSLSAYHVEMFSIRTACRVGALSGLLALTFAVVPVARAAPASGTGANVTWTSGSLGSSSGSGTFACGVSASVSMAAGGFNSGIAYSVDWSSATGTAAAFPGGVTPASSIAILANNTGNAGTLSFGAEITDPVVLVAYIDPGAEMDFSPNPITVLSSHSGAGGTPTVVGSKISLSGPNVDTVNDGWAVKVTGTFGPTSGSLPLSAFATSGETFAISVASPTVCPSGDPDPAVTTTVAPSAPGQPGVPTVTPAPGGLMVTVSPPSTGGAPLSYLATAAPGGRTCSVTGPSGACRITRLSSKKTYSVTVVATNSSGTSAASAASAKVTPLPSAAESDTIPATGWGWSLLLATGSALLMGGWCGLVWARRSRPASVIATAIPLRER